MAKIECPDCGHRFDMNNPDSVVTRIAAAAAGCGIGAVTGARIGIAGGPVGAASGLIPGAIVGAGAGLLFAGMFRKCPGCRKIFKT